MIWDPILPKGYSTDQGLERVCCVGLSEDLCCMGEVAEALQRCGPCAVYCASPDEEELDLLLSCARMAVFLVNDSFETDSDAQAALALAKEKRLPTLFLPQS